MHVLDVILDHTWREEAALVDASPSLFDDLGVRWETDFEESGLFNDLTAVHPPEHGANEEQRDIIWRRLFHHPYQSEQPIGDQRAKWGVDHQSCLEVFPHAALVLVEHFIICTFPENLVAIVVYMVQHLMLVPTVVSLGYPMLVLAYVCLPLVLSSELGPIGLLFLDDGLLL